MLENEGSSCTVNHESPVFHVGKVFRNAESLKFCLQQHSVMANFSFCYVKNDLRRIVIRFNGNHGPWYLWGKKLADGVSWKISVHNDHTCAGVNKVENLQTTAKRVAKNILADVKANQNITPAEIKRLVHHKFSPNLTYNKAWRGKEITKEILFGKVEESYAYVEDLIDELLKRNHGSYIVVEKQEDN